MSFSGFRGVFIPRTLNEKKNPHAPDREQLFGGGFFPFGNDFALMGCVLGLVFPIGKIAACSAA